MIECENAPSADGRSWVDVDPDANAPSADGRSWVEIDLDALSQNVSALRACLPRRCDLMAVVKADAYGHGAEAVAKRLWREGVGSFAVATLSEGALLREAVPEGEILVLGYTHPKDAGLLSARRLTQLAVDGAYAKALNETGYKINAHIAIDTGMHRLGIESSTAAEIESVFECENLTVTGVATHLASSDSSETDDIEFTNNQIERFNTAVDALRRGGRDVGKLHVQASYGVCNYPGLEYDYARAGIMLYGVMSHDGKTEIKPALRPVLSLRARVAQVRWISTGDSVSYGRAFKAEKPVRIATVCAGYADGFPRQASGNGGQLLVRGRKVPIIGRVCMDMVMADVTGADDVCPGDIATLIGTDGDEEARCEDVALASGTITNDILCRLGSRLPRIYV